MRPIDYVTSELRALNPLDPADLVAAFGLIGVWAILFAETGLLIGFFLPGDSLLFLAGMAASAVGDELVGTSLSLPGLLIGAPICAIAGAQLGHWLGMKYGRHFFDRPDSRFFKKEYVEKAEYYFTKFGPAKAVVLARFIPIVRTFLNPVAGALGMPTRTFLLWNVIGGIVWTDGLITAGYFLGDRIAAETVDKYLLPAVALIIFLSITPILFEVWRSWRARRRDAASGDSPSAPPKSTQPGSGDQAEAAGRDGTSEGELGKADEVLSKSR